MNGIWNLTSFEYKKILRKKSVQITLLLAALVTAFSVVATFLGSYYLDGKSYESNYDAMVKDRAFARALSGLPLDKELLLEAANAYAQIPEAEVYQATQEYQTTARPYSPVYSIVRSIFSTNSKRFNMEDFQILTEVQADSFYTLRRERLEHSLLQTRMGSKAKTQLLTLDEQIQTPFTFSYTDGYTKFFVMVTTLGLTSMFVLAVCTAPLFSGEYSSGADQLILSSKRGKNRLIAAKLITGFSLAAIICLALFALTFCMSLAIIGADGKNSPLQLYYVSSPYPLTMGQTALLLTIVSLFACLMTAAVTMLLSSKLKSPFGVIVLVSVLLIAPMLGNAPENNILLYRLYLLFPTQMASFSSAVTVIQYELFGLVIRPYVFFPLFALAVSILLTHFTYHSFQKHQVG